jgi:hypothetical protein
VNSKVATKFRQWATQTLKQHITQGFTINKNHLAQHYEQFMQAVEEVKKLAQNQALPTDDILELVKLFSQTWFSIDAFDRGKIITGRQTQRKVKVQAKELYTDLLKLKQDLLQRDEATDVFVQEREA